MNIKAIIHPAEEGGYWAEVPELVGCITEGDTMEEVMANLKDVIVGWLDVANNRKVKHFSSRDAMEAMLIGRNYWLKANSAVSLLHEIAIRFFINCYEFGRAV